MFHTVSSITLNDIFKVKKNYQFTRCHHNQWHMHSGQTGLKVFLIYVILSMINFTASKDKKSSYSQEVLYSFIRHWDFASNVDTRQMPYFVSCATKITKFIETFHNVTCVKTMNILIVNQSIVDMIASFFTLLTTVVQVDGTRMSRDIIQAGARHVTCRVCHVISPTTCSFVTSGLQDSRSGCFSMYQPTTFFSWHWNATLPSSIPSGTKPT